MTRLAYRLLVIIAAVIVGWHLLTLMLAAAVCS
jgi:hypothetical protein